MTHGAALRRAARFQLCLTVVVAFTACKPDASVDNVSIASPSGSIAGLGPCNVPTPGPGEVLPSNNILLSMYDDSEFFGGPANLPRCIEIEVQNQGSVRHNFSIKGTTIDFDIPPGGSRTTQQLALPPGMYTLFCKYHRAPGRTKTMTIQRRGP